MADLVKICLLLVIIATSGVVSVDFNGDCEKPVHDRCQQDVVNIWSNQTTCLRNKLYLDCLRIAGLHCGQEMAAKIRTQAEEMETNCEKDGHHVSEYGGYQYFKQDQFNQSVTKLSPGSIVGITIGSISLVVVIVIVILYFISYRTKSK